MSDALTLSDSTPTRPRPSLDKIWQVELSDYIHLLSWSPTSPRILAGSASGEALVMDATSGTILKHLEAHTLGTLCGGWSYDGQYLATGGQDGKIHLYDARQLTRIACLEMGKDWVEHLVWSPHQNQFSAAAGRQLRVWDETGQAVFTFAPHESTIAGLSWHPNLNHHLATTSYNGLRRFQVGNPHPIRHFKWKGSSLKCFWRPDGKFIASATQDGTVHVWEAKTGNDMQMPGYPMKPTAQAWDTSSRFLATGGSYDVMIWDFSGKGPVGTTPLMLEGHSDFVNALAYQPKGPLLASGCHQGQILVWYPDMTDQAFVSAQHASAISQLAWSIQPQGEQSDMLASGDALGNLCGWLPSEEGTP